MSDPDFLAGGSLVHTALPAEPVGARIDTLTSPALFYIEDADQFQQLKGGCVDMGGQFGDFVTQAFQIR